jgi:hypothetical protein
MNTIERVIITALLRNMRAEGYQPAAVWDGGAYQMADDKTYEPDKLPMLSRKRNTAAPEEITRSMTDEEALRSIDSVCECTLHFTHRNAKTWGNRGVLLILGNGEDVISDFHDAADEPFSEIINTIYNRVAAGQLP